MLTRNTFVFWLLSLFCTPPSLCAEERWQWQETVNLSESCTLFFSAHYLPENANARWPNARFSAQSACFSTPWQALAPMRVVQQHNATIYAIDEFFQCQQLVNNQWQSCALSETPVHGFYRSLWGPIRVASAELKALHDDERRVLSERHRGVPYQHFNDTFSEQLWLRRWCGEPTPIVQHFERWAACTVKLNQQLQPLLNQVQLSPFDFRPASKIDLVEETKGSIANP